MLILNLVVADSSLSLDKPDAAQVSNIWSKILPKAVIDSDGNLKIHGSIVLQPSAKIVQSDKEDSDIHMTLDDAPVEETEEDTLSQHITTENVANTVLQRLRQHNFDDSDSGEIILAPFKHIKQKFRGHDEDNTVGEVYERTRPLYKYTQKLRAHGYDKPEDQSDGIIISLTPCHQQSSLIFVDIDDTNEDYEPENPNKIEDATFLEHRFRGHNRYSATADPRRVFNDKRELTFKSNPGAVHNGDGFHMENDLKERMIEDEVRKLLHLQEQAMKYGNIMNPPHFAEANNPNLGIYTTRNVRREGVPFEFSKLRRVPANPDIDPIHSRDIKSKIRPIETVSGTLDFYKTENIDLDMDSEITDLFKHVKLFKKSEESYGHTIIEDPVTSGSTMHFQVTFQPSGLLNENIVKGLNTHFLLGLDTEAASKKVVDKNSYDYSEDRGLKQKSQLTESMPDKSRLIELFPPPNEGFTTSELSKIHNVPQRAENGKISQIEGFS